MFHSQHNANIKENKLMTNNDKKFIMVPTEQDYKCFTTIYYKIDKQCVVYYF